MSLGRPLLHLRTASGPWTVFSGCNRIEEMAGQCRAGAAAPCGSPRSDLGLPGSFLTPPREKPQCGAPCKPVSGPKPQEAPQISTPVQATGTAGKVYYFGEQDGYCLSARGYVIELVSGKLVAAVGLGDAQQKTDWPTGALDFLMRSRRESPPPITQKDFSSWECRN